MRTWQIAIALALVTACGPDDRSLPAVDAGTSPDDDAAVVIEDASSSVDTMDAPLATCFVPAASSDHSAVTYTLTGGSFLAMGCQPIDPTYWIHGADMSVTMTFATPQDHPSIRVWGMNNDDTASVAVNQIAYPLDTTSASLSAKVVCGESPGPDGMLFQNGLLTGPAVGNYSYQDVTLAKSGVTSIQLVGLTGAGWGFVGATVNGCSAGPL